MIDILNYSKSKLYLKILSSKRLILVIFSDTLFPIHLLLWSHDFMLIACSISVHRFGSRFSRAILENLSRQVSLANFLSKWFWLQSLVIQCLSTFLTTMQKVFLWLKLSLLGNELLDTVTSKVWSTQADIQVFSTPSSIIVRYSPRNYSGFSYYIHSVTDNHRVHW